MEYSCYYHERMLGFLKISGSSEGISKVQYINGDNDVINNLITYSYLPENMFIKEDFPSGVYNILYECIEELNQYFAGIRKTFTVKLFLEGTEFQRRVWNEVSKIPYGCTASYKEIASAVGNKKAARAVGNANNKNKIPIIIPCHRIIGGNGHLTGYAGGLWRKEWLLAQEEKNVL